VLLLRQIRSGRTRSSPVFVDLALERACVPRACSSEVVPLDGEDLSREKEARFTMLETLADHDDELMEQLLEDIPRRATGARRSSPRSSATELICPVLIGVATRTNGVLRLLKALRHETHGVAEDGQAPRREVRQRSGRLCDRRPSIPRMAASCRSRACWRAGPATARR